MFRVSMIVMGVFVGLVVAPVAVPGAVLFLAQRSRDKFKAEQAAFAEQQAEFDMAALYRGVR